jgi:hypothetical protein
MGLTYSRSVRFGAVRFNFSGSGIGVSVGIPGLRIGTGPRGAYVSGGVGGFRYRRSLAHSPSRTETPVQARPRSQVPVAQESVPNVLDTVSHDDKNVLELTDSNGDGLLQSMNEQRQKTPFWPIAGGLAFFAYLVFASQMQEIDPRWRALLALVLVGVCAWVYWRDTVRRLTVLFYEPDVHTGALYETLRVAIATAGTSQKLKSIASTSRYADTKYSAGAGQGLAFASASLVFGQPPGVAANIDMPLLKTGRTTLAFLPDRILAFQGNAVGAVSYAHLRTDSERTRYVESESLPSDATVIDRTWQYVNKSGGPDRRFRNNPQYPVCAYSKLLLSTASGLDIRLLASKERSFEPLVQALEQMA